MNTYYFRAPYMAHAMTVNAPTMKAARVAAANRLCHARLPRGTILTLAEPARVAADEYPTDASEAVRNGSMTWDRWQRLPRDARMAARDNSKLCAELIGLEGCRVECIRYGERVRFNVGMSTGWRPSHIALHNSRSSGGGLISAGSVSELRVIRSRP